jgi:hypothetical protein
MKIFLRKAKEKRRRRRLHHHHHHHQHHHCRRHHHHHHLANIELSHLLTGSRILTWFLLPLTL